MRISYCVANQVKNRIEYFWGLGGRGVYRGRLDPCARYGQEPAIGTDLVFVVTACHAQILELASQGVATPAQ